MLTLHCLSFGQFVAEELNSELSRQSLVPLHSSFPDCQPILPWETWEEVWMQRAGLVSPRGLLESSSSSLPSFSQTSQNKQVEHCTFSSAAALACLMDGGWGWEKQSHKSASWASVGTAHASECWPAGGNCSTGQAAAEEHREGSFIPLVRTLISSFHFAIRAAVINILSHLLVLAAHNFLMDMLSFKDPQIAACNYSMTWVFI